MPASLMLLLAAAAFEAAACVHYQSPMLGAIAREYGVNAAAAGWIATLTFAGYLSGMALIVPLGDRLDKRTVILAQSVGLLAATLAMALAPSLAVAAAVSYVIGVCACLTQTVIPVVVELSPASGRGRVVGTLLSALFMGILFGRLTGGFIADHFGWRWTYVMAALLMAALAPALALRLPRMPAKTSLSYFALIHSVIRLVHTYPELRRSSAIQFFLGICYGGFWATIAPMLSLLHGLGATEAGLIGIPGASGILISRTAGRWMDRRGPFPVVTTATCLVVAAFLLMQAAEWSVWIIILGAVLLDFGLRGAMVANQTLINTIAPDARSRASTVFGAHVWGGNAIGAFLVSTALAFSGWGLACSLALASAACALLLQLKGGPRKLPARNPGR